MSAVMDIIARTVDASAVKRTRAEALRYHLTTGGGLCARGELPMQRKADDRNIPIDLLRTAVAIAETGSYTKAARELGLSQPAVSLQVKRLQKLFVGEIFDVSSGRPQLTAYGEAIIDSGRRILGINDELLSLANVKPHGANQIVVGLHNSIASQLQFRLFKKLTFSQGREIVFRNLSSHSLLKGLEGGYIDIALLIDPIRIGPVAVLEWWEPLHWVKGPGFRVDLSKPLALVSFPGGLSDRIAIGALKRIGLRYRIAFVSTQISSRLAAVRAGMGMMVLAQRATTEDVVIADDADLPELPRARCGIYLRHGLDRAQVEWIIGALESELRPREQYELIAPQLRKLAVVKSR
jgi:DNA-binding transcriptional LysR family regulator